MQSETITNNQITLNPDYTPNLISLDMNDYQPRRLITVFIIHGYLASIESKWMVEMAAAYLTRVSFILTQVNWMSNFLIFWIKKKMIRHRTNPEFSLYVNIAFLIRKTSLKCCSSIQMKMKNQFLRILNNLKKDLIIPKL